MNAKLTKFTPTEEYRQKIATSLRLHTRRLMLHQLSNGANQKT